MTRSGRTFWISPYQDCRSSHCCTMKMEAPLICVRVLLRIRKSLDYNVTSLSHKLTRMTKS